MGLVDGAFDHWREAVVMVTQLMVEFRPFAAEKFNEALNCRDIRGEKRQADDQHYEAKRQWQRQDNKTCNDEQRP